MKLASTILLIAMSLGATEKSELARPDGSRLIIYFDAPEKESYPVALVLQGSQCGSVLGTHEEWKDPLLKMGYAVASVEKRGVSGVGEVALKEFDETNSIDQRVSDHLLLIAHLRKGRGEWNRRLTIIGASEGGEVGGIVAARTPETQALLLFCAGGGWTKMEELMWSFRKQLVDDHYSPLYVQSFLVESKEQLFKALENPSHKHRAYGFTYKYWASTLRHRLLEELSKLHCPIYIVQGALDDRIPSASADFLVKTLKGQGKSSIQYRKVEGMGHDPRQDPSVYREALSWLEALSP